MVKSVMEERLSRGSYRDFWLRKGHYPTCRLSPNGFGHLREKRPLRWKWSLWSSDFPPRKNNFQLPYGFFQRAQELVFSTFRRQSAPFPLLHTGPRYELEPSGFSRYEPLLLKHCPLPHGRKCRCNA